jgi:hypothetical protein
LVEVNAFQVFGHGRNLSVSKGTCLFPANLCRYSGGT